MVEIRQTDAFVTWLAKLRDRNARLRIVARIRRMEMGNPGHWRSVGEGIREMKIDYGPGYRIYYVHRGEKVVILLCGGAKKTQEADIATAKKMAEEFEDGTEDNQI